MSVLSGKKILLGISASIAAYKTAMLVRLLVKVGAEVKVVMTPAAKDFVTPLTLSTLSKNPVLSVFYEEENEDEQWNNHIDLALWADFMLLAPATANTLAKMANGICDNLVLAVYLSAKCPVYFAPAMDVDMYKHPSTAKSIETLQGFGKILIPAATGELASGLFGEGRMAEPEEIVALLEKDLRSTLPLRGKKVLITAGPTYENIDPVRFIGNHSSGKMGFEIAKEVARLGAQVYLVAGPSSENIHHSSVTRIDVTSAKEMYDAAYAHFNEVAIAIFSAAVADYAPKKMALRKIKKDTATLTLELTRTKDVLASLAKLKKEQFLVGFALETHDEVEHAKKKLQRKNLDMIVLNSLRDKGSGFAGNTNKITIIDSALKKTTFPLQSKADVAKDIVGEVLKKIHG